MIQFTNTETVVFNKAPYLVSRTQNIKYENIQIEIFIDKIRFT